MISSLLRYMSATQQFNILLHYSIKGKESKWLRLYSRIHAIIGARSSSKRFRFSQRVSMYSSICVHLIQEHAFSERPASGTEPWHLIIASDSKAMPNLNIGGLSSYGVQISAGSCASRHASTAEVRGGGESSAACHSASYGTVALSISRVLVFDAASVFTSCPEKSMHVAELLSADKRCATALDCVLSALAFAFPLVAARRLMHLSASSAVQGAAEEFTLEERRSQMAAAATEGAGYPSLTRILTRHVPMTALHECAACSQPSRSRAGGLSVF